MFVFVWVQKHDYLTVVLLDCLVVLALKPLLDNFDWGTHELVHEEHLLTFITEVGVALEPIFLLLLCLFVDLDLKFFEVSIFYKVAALLKVLFLVGTEILEVRLLSLFKQTLLFLLKKLASLFFFKLGFLSLLLPFLLFTVRTGERLSSKLTVVRNRKHVM